MLDFAALPPEINSTRMYTGPGSGPMMAAAAAWDAVAAQWESFVARYLSELADLEGQFWSGPAAAAMAGAAAPFVTWASGVAMQADQAATQARAAATAYETAHAATVPPEVVAANRTLLATLIATNFFGQNALAIAATEALYLEFWAQDAVAMYGYAASSLPAAATLKPVEAPPQTTNVGGQSAQHVAAAQAVGSAAVQKAQTLISALPHQLHSVSSGSSSAPSVAASGSSSAPAAVATGSSTTASSTYYITNWQTFEQFYNIFNSAINKNFYNGGVTIGDQADFSVTVPKWLMHYNLPRTPPFLYAGEADALSFLGGNSTTLASTGSAVSVGALSVPQSWASASPAVNQTALVENEVPQPPSMETVHRSVLTHSAKPTMDQPPPSLGPMAGTGQRHTGNAVLRMRDRRFRMPRFAAGG